MANLTTSDQRMLDLIEILKEMKEIQFALEFCTVAGILKQNLTRVRNGVASFTGAHIENVCKNYNINANWIFDLDPNVFRGKKNTTVINNLIAELRKVKRVPMNEPKARKKRSVAKTDSTDPGAH